ncbi:MAG: sel1 repeat family protein [Elusimicrobiota bacterium]|jgi:TPR repeat protein|nr:sel1 repeat family protein [Elusimicrobiota bacterium]
MKLRFIVLPLLAVSFFCVNIYGAKVNPETNVKLTTEEIIKQAQSSDSQAQLILGKMYMDGTEFPANFEQAIFWMTKAADANFAPAQNELGQIYLLEQYQNYAQALIWFKKAARQNYVPAINNLAQMYEFGAGADIAPNEKIAREYYLQSAKLNDPFAICSIAYHFMLINNFEEAFEWYQKAADLGYAEAQYYLGEMYMSGQGVRQNSKLAIKWYQKAADQKYFEAQFALADFYYNNQEFKKAFEIYKRLAEEGNAGAQKILGDMYYSGIGVKQNFSSAFMWYEKASLQSLPEALFSLGIMYRDGIGVQQDVQKGRALIEEAEQSGFLQEDIKKDFMSTQQMPESALDLDEE